MTTDVFWMLFRIFIFVLFLLIVIYNVVKYRKEDRNEFKSKCFCDKKYMTITKSTPMRKIVINTRIGGFDLSNIAVREYLRLIGKDAFFYKYDFKNDGYYTKISESDIEQPRVAFYISTTDRGDKFQDTDENEFMLYEIKRDDPNLISAIEKIGTELSSTDHSILKIVEIPDDVEWIIYEDEMGPERIAEKHRIWE